jgi:hypothetical protein
MKRFHVHIAVKELNDSINFYSQLFNTEPTVQKEDYAKWELDDPAVNFAISTRSSRTGLDHVGIQTDSEVELAELRQQIEAAGISGIAQENTTCCYTRSDKYWVQDPQGIAWETFHSLESVPVFSDDRAGESGAACCTPELPVIDSGCC